jgi:hypothetical protein
MAHWGGPHADQVPREALGVPAQLLPLAFDRRVIAAARLAQTGMRILTNFPGQFSKECTSTT